MIASLSVAPHLSQVASWFGEALDVVLRHVPPCLVLLTEASVPGVEGTG